MCSIDSDKVWTDFLNVISEMPKNELENFMQLFLTADEKLNLVYRFLIVKGLLKGNLSQRELASDINVSIAKITRGSNALKMFDKDFIQNLKQKLEIGGNNV